MTTTPAKPSGTPPAKSGSPPGGANPQPKADGPYYSAEFPLLGAVTALCCNRTEREKSWEDKQFDMSTPVAWCWDRYGLSDAHTRLLLAPEAQRARPCLPTEEQAELVAHAVIAELSGKKPSTTPKTISQPFDPPLETRYPTVAALYRAYVLGSGHPPPNWQKDLVAEFRKGASTKDDIW